MQTAGDGLAGPSVEFRNVHNPSYLEFKEMTVSSLLPVNNNGGIDVDSVAPLFLCLSTW